jgi:diguanylate cyclase (GGDEF)-like protein
LSTGWPAVEKGDAESWSSADLAGVLSALCRECTELTGVVACSIVVKDPPFGFFSAAGSAEWACILDDFQLSEETGPTWECCQTAKTTQGDGRGHRGLTGEGLDEQLSHHGVIGCRALPLVRHEEIWGALTLYWDASTRQESLLTAGIAFVAMAIKAIEGQHQEAMNDAQVECPGLPETPASPAGGSGGDVDQAATYQKRDALSEAREARANARDARALDRDERAAERDRRAAERDAQARVRDDALLARLVANGWANPEMLAVQVHSRRDRYAAARDRFQARSDRAAARMDRVVSAIERVESSIDGLTGAYRRDAGMLELEHEVTRARRTGDTFVLAFVDVNNLKIRNDTRGHLAGDQLLRKIADTLRANVRSYDLVVRYGGDEFVCGFPALDVKDATERFERINGDLAATDEASVAFGLAELETDDSLADLITRADSVMYANRYQRLRDGGNAANTNPNAPNANSAQRVARISSNAD